MPTVDIRPADLSCSGTTKDLDEVLRFYRHHGFKSWYVEMFM